VTEKHPNAQTILSSHRPVTSLGHQEAKSG